MKNLHTMTSVEMGIEAKVIKDSRGIVVIARDTDADELITVRIYGDKFKGDAEAAAVEYATKFVA